MYEGVLLLHGIFASLIYVGFFISLNIIVLFFNVLLESDVIL